MSELEDLKEKYISKANELIRKYGELVIIYIRVSTKKQEELDQLQDILTTFKLERKQCMIIRAKESAFQLSKQKNRKFNIILDLIRDVDINVSKRCYFWSIDRIYRNRELLEEFYSLAKKTNTGIYAHIESFINDINDIPFPEEVMFVKDMMIKNIISMLGWVAESESKKKGKRLKKSLTMKEGRTYSNKGNLYGKKLTTITGKKIKDPEFLDKLEKAIMNRINKRIPYIDIQKIVLEKFKIKVSTGKITNIKNKFINRKVVSE